MEAEPLLTGSINRNSADYGSPENVNIDRRSPKTRRLSYSVDEESCKVEGGK